MEKKEQQLIKNYNELNYRQQHDEIDLYDLVDILVKNRKTIILTTVLITLLALGAALFDRGRTYNKQGINFSIDESIASDFFVKKSGIEVSNIGIKNVLNSDEAVEKLFEIPELRAFYEKKSKDGERGLYSMRKFLNERVAVNVNEQEIVNDGVKIKKELGGTLELGFEKDIELERKVGDRFLELYSELNLGKILSEMDRKSKFIEQQAKESEMELTAKENEFFAVVERESKIATKDTDINAIVKLKYPKLMTDLDRLKELYEKFSNEYEGVTGFRKESKYDTLIQKTSSYYRIEVKSKAKLILGVGMILGIFLGIFMAFIGEFIEGYKKRSR